MLLENATFNSHILGGSIEMAFWRFIQWRLEWSLVARGWGRSKRLTVKGKGSKKDPAWCNQDLRQPNK